MNRELFGVFGGIDAFERFRSSEDFDEVLTGSTVTVGIRDSDLRTPGWSATYSRRRLLPHLGEAYVPDDEPNTARWLLEHYESAGVDALQRLNGSYLAVIDTEASEEAFVATDPIRSRECFYTDESGTRVFGTDSAEVTRTITDPTLHRNGILEFLHLGVTLGAKRRPSRDYTDSRSTVDSRPRQSTRSNGSSTTHSRLRNSTWSTNSPIASNERSNGGRRCPDKGAFLLGGLRLADRPLTGRRYRLQLHGRLTGRTGGPGCEIARCTVRHESHRLPTRRAISPARRVEDPVLTGDQGIVAHPPRRLYGRDRSRYDVSRPPL